MFQPLDASVFRLTRCARCWLLERITPEGEQTVITGYPAGIPAHEVLWRATAEYPGRLIAVGALD